MHEIVRLITQNVNLKNVIFYAESEDSAYICLHLFELKKFDSFSIISSEYMRDNIEGIFEEIKSDTNSENKAYFPDIKWYITGEHISDTLENESDVFIFDTTEHKKAIIEYAYLKPYHVIGQSFDSYDDSYDIWEKYRRISTTIDIISYPENEIFQALRWDKGESDIELSVVFPMYNVAKYLPQCVESVTEWKADYVEFLFVDDGSPDNSAEIIEEYAKKDPRIKLIRKPNGGCASARQKGMENAKGRYVGFIDPDDFIDTEMYHKLLRAAISGNYQMAYCGYNEYYESTGTSRPVPDILGEPYMSGTTEPNDICALASFMRVAIWRGIYCMDTIRDAGIHFYEDIRRFDDLIFKMETLAVVKSVISVPEYLYYYRLDRPGQDVSANDERLYVHFPIFAYLDAFYGKIGKKELIDSLQTCKIHTHIYAIEKIQNKYLREYCRQAKKDLDSGYGYKRSKLLFSFTAGRSVKLYHRCIHHKWILLIKFLKWHQNKKKNAAESAQKDIIKKIQDAQSSL